MQATAAVAVDYGVMVATLLAISLAGERIVTIVKTPFPGWFAETAAVVPGAPAPSLPQDRGRRLRVQAVAFGACWLAAASLSGFRFLGTVDVAGITLAVPLVGLLATGGSAFWSQVLGITSALKDLKQAQASGARTDKPEQTPAPKRGLAPGDPVEVGGMNLVGGGARA